MYIDDIIDTVIMSLRPRARNTVGGIIPGSEVECVTRRNNGNL